MTSNHGSRLSQAALIGVLLGAAGSATSQGWPQIALVPKLSGFSKPVHVTNAGDRSGRLFVVEQQGRIRIVKNGTLVSTPFLDITDRVSCCGERGLLSVAFPPGFRTPGYFLVDYTDLNGDTKISQFYVDWRTPDLVDPGSEQIILRIAQPYANHNGGQIAFGPDGFLYIGMGDGGSEGDPENYAQNPASLLGKMLRIDPWAWPTYGVPPSNPFVSNAAYRPEIWALGLRNPWRFSFDRKTGDLYIADVGQDSREEVDFQPASSAGGENYGWRIMEGTACYDPPNCDPTGLVLPVTEYTHSGGDCAVTGGFVYRGLSYAGLEGIYFYGDYCTGRIRGLRRTAAGWESRVLLDAGFAISSFGEDEAGELYLLDYGGGVLYQVADAAGPSSVLTVPAVVDVAGSGGARYTTDLTLANRGTTPVSLDLTYTPAESIGASGGGTVSDALGAGLQKTIPDAIAYLRQKGIPIPTSGQQGGTLRIRATGASNSDVVYAAARTTAPSGPGQAGLAYPAVGPNEMPESSVRLFGLRENAAFRTNLALLSAGDPAGTSTITLKVTLTSGDPGDSRTAELAPVSLGPGQWLQLNHVLSQAGMSNGWATIERIGGVDPFYAYAVVNDNVTNDGSFVAPTSSGPAVSGLMVPVAAHTAGFVTDLVLTNSGEEAITVSFRDASSDKDVVLQPHEQRFIPDVVSYLVTAPASGPLQIFSNIYTAELHAGARTWSAPPSGGSFGVAYPALTPGQSPLPEAWIFGLRQDDLSRSNLAVGVIDPPTGGIPSGVYQLLDLSLDVFDGHFGTLVGTRTCSLDPMLPDWVQFSSILAGFGVSSGYVRVRVTSGSGSFGVMPIFVYGVVNDGAVPGEGTGDGSYLPMVIPLPPSPFPP